MSENTPEPTLIARFMNGLDSKQISDFTVIVRDNPSITDIEAMAQAVLALRAVTEPKKRGRKPRKAVEA